MLSKLKFQTSVGKRFSTQISAFPTALALALVFMSVLGINAQRIYDNGPLATGAVARNGTAAPAGAQYSEVSNNFGETAVSNTVAGYACQRAGTADNRCADDFNVPVGQTWTINQVIVFAYQTGATANPVVAANLRIWNGIPGAGGTVIFGDTTTNRLAASTDSGLFRIFNSGPPGNTVPGTTRRIWQVAINVAPAQVLTAGNYWVDFQIDAGAGGNFSPTTTIIGTRGVPGWNARQSIGGVTWAEIFDDGNPATAVNVVQDFPFKLNGTISGAPAIPSHRRMDFDGDNRSDAVVARAANATAQSTWAISYSTNIPSTTTPFGTGVGIPGGDIATPEDFDGDGKTDIAVWRNNPFGSGFSN
ncbi:MAG: VCBS repeat-containing protein, partial [Acidobacteriota bacterium]|nr:VCBS repeat-containing protein [Acidobacteriota bacterium]